MEAHKCACVILLSCSLCCLPLVGHDTDHGKFPPPPSSPQREKKIAINVTFALVLTWRMRSQQLTPGEVRCMLTREETATDLNFSLSKSESFLTEVGFETRPPRVSQSVRLQAPPTSPGTKITSSKTCKQSAIIMCTPNGDMINLISRRPANNARKCWFLSFFSPLYSNLHVPGMWIGPVRSIFPICRVYHVIVTVFNSEILRLNLYSDFSVALYISKLTSASSQSWK